MRVGQIRANRAPLPGRLGSKNDGDGHHIELIRGEVGQDGNREFNGSPKQCIYASRYEPDGGGVEKDEEPPLDSDSPIAQRVNSIRGPTLPFIRRSKRTADSAGAQTASRFAGELPAMGASGSLSLVRA